MKGKLGLAVNILTLAAIGGLVYWMVLMLKDLQ
jgi:hypothetical protein